MQELYKKLALGCNSGSTENILVQLQALIDEYNAWNTEIHANSYSPTASGIPQIFLLPGSVALRTTPKIYQQYLYLMVFYILLQSILVSRLV